IGAKEAFVLEGPVAEHAILYSVPLSGGAPVALRSVKDAHILGINADALFFSDVVSASGETAILRRGLAAGDTRAIVGAALLELDSDVRIVAHVDERSVYYGELGKLMRVDANGGTPEMLWDEANRPVAAVTSDACDVYWLEIEKADRDVGLFERAKN